MKNCTSCEQELDLTCFYRHKKMKDGYRNQCKSCYLNRLQIKYKSNPLYRSQLAKYKKTDQAKITRHRREQNNLNIRLKGALRTRLRCAINNNQKCGSAVRDLGCSIDYFKEYMESQFLPGMSWQNWGLHGWHIDHKKPLAAFDLTNRDELRKAVHFTNLQPLWAEANLAKTSSFQV